MKHRMAVSVLALVGAFVALYLFLWKIGFVGDLSCRTDGCETVQMSAYSEFLGLPVALYGLLGFLSLLAVSLMGLQTNWIHRREPTVLLIILSGIGVAFSAYLTYLEAAVIHAWCQWCVASAIIITAVFFVSVGGALSWPKSEKGA